MKLVFAIALALVVCGGQSAARESSVKELIPKATVYSHQFIERFSNVVAEERYEQQITVPHRKRMLLSDFLLVRYPGDPLWQTFRDVAEVDGKPVRDRQDRMMKLFLEPSSSALRRASELGRASARHNLVDVGTLSNPLLVMAFLQTAFVSTSLVSTRRSDRTCELPDSSSSSVRPSSSWMRRRICSRVA